jgi:transposase-like protein
MSKQKSYTKEFKFKVAIEMIKGDLTIAEIISKYQVPRSVLSKWKKQLLDNGPEIYKKGNQPVQGYNNCNRGRVEEHPKMLIWILRLLRRSD